MSFKYSEFCYLPLQFVFHYDSEAISASWLHGTARTPIYLSPFKMRSRNQIGLRDLINHHRPNVKHISPSLDATLITHYYRTGCSCSMSTNWWWSNVVAGKCITHLFSPQTYGWIYKTVDSSNFKLNLKSLRKSLFRELEELLKPHCPRSLYAVVVCNDFRSRALN